MIGTASGVRLSLSSLIASVGVLLGASIQYVASPSGGLTALFGVLVFALAASTAAEMLCHRPRAARTAADQLCAGPMQDQAEQLARHDVLTGLLNRNALCARLQNILAGRRRGDRCTAVLLLDLIDFRGINVRPGCAAGDRLLRHGGARLLGHPARYGHARPNGRR